MALSAYMQDREYVLHRRRVARSESQVARLRMTPLARPSL